MNRAQPRDPLRLLLRVIPLVALGLLAGSQLRAELPPDQHIDQKRTCLECHDLAALNAPVQHAPVRDGECSACHNPHVARFAALLRQQPGPLCESCHAEVTQERSLSSVHPPVAEGRCSACHQPHGSVHGGLLTEPGGDLCATCHSAVTDWQKRRVQHVPFARGRCATCHEPHASAADGLLTAAGAATCTGCHGIDASFRAAHGGYPVERAPCQTCHDPHASAKRGLFRETVHAPFESGDCGICHAGAGAADPFATVASEDRLCGDCHEEQVALSRAAPFPHVSGGGGRCTSCHNPHAGEGAAMLRKEPNATCLSCHDPGGAKSGQEGRFATHAEELECTTCHAPHGGERPLFLAEDPVDVCGTCHTHEHGIRHPLGEETLDPRTGSPMDCGSCHGIHEAPYDMYLHASDEGDLCIGCHRDIGRGRS